jgi:hypothetical protein
MQGIDIQKEPLRQLLPIQRNYYAPIFAAGAHVA